jgi:hypothetical protein
MIVALHSIEVSKNLMRCILKPALVEKSSAHLGSAETPRAAEFIFEAKILS